MGSPVKSCPYNPNSRISLMKPLEKNKYFKKKSYKCKECDARYQKKANLNFHVKRKHEIY